MEQFSTEELRNILALISAAPITGGQALTVVMLQQKITKALEPKVEEGADPTKNKS